MLRLVIAVVVVGGCSKSTEDEIGREVLARRVPKLEAALAQRNEIHATTECAMLEGSISEMTPELAKRIERGCFVDAPSLILTNGIAKVVEANRKHADMADLNCMELFVPGALQTVAKHPVADPALQKLVNEYTRLCPKEAAKARDSATAMP